MHRLHPHPLLGEEGISRLRGGGGRGEAVGGHPSGRPRGRRGRSGALADPPGHPPAPYGHAQRAEPGEPPLQKQPGHGPDHPPAGGGRLGGGQHRHQVRRTLHRQHAHGGDLHRAPAHRGGRRGVRGHAPGPQRRDYGQVPHGGP